MAILHKRTVERIAHETRILLVQHEYVGRINTPLKYNKAVADALKATAFQIGKIKDAWVDPRIRVWTNQRGIITCEAVIDEARCS